MTAPDNPRGYIPPHLYDQALAAVAAVLASVPDDELVILQGFLLDGAARRAMNMRAFGTPYVPRRHR